MSTVLVQDQRMRALVRANEIRVYRAAVKRELAAGEKRFGQVLSDPDCQTMAIREVLMALPRVGETKTQKVLRRAGKTAGAPIAESRTLEQLTPRQVVALEYALRAFPTASAACLVA